MQDEIKSDRLLRFLPLLLVGLITHYRSALRIDPNLSAAQQGLARALRQTGGEAK